MCSCFDCISLLTEADAGHTEFMDEVFQNETRFPGGEWKAASESFTDVVSATQGLEFSVVVFWQNKRNCF